MFTFNTETIINDSTYRDSMGRTLNPNRWEISPNKYVWVYPDKRFTVSPKTKYNIAPAISGENPRFAQGSIDISTITNKAELDRIHVILKWDLKPAASFANSFVNKTRDYYLTIPSTGVNAALIAHWNIQNKQHSVPLVCSLAGEVITITSTDEFALMTTLQAEILTYDDRTGHENITVSKGTITEKGFCGRGTGKLLMFNNRMLTMENTRFFATLQDEKPMVGELYTKIVLTQSTERTITGKDAIGSLTTSVTQHTFWVRQVGDLVSTFSAALQEGLFEPVVPETLSVEAKTTQAPLTRTATRK